MKCIDRFGQEWITRQTQYDSYDQCTRIGDRWYTTSTWGYGTLEAALNMEATVKVFLMHPSGLVTCLRPIE